MSFELGAKMVSDNIGQKFLKTMKICHAFASGLDPNSFVSCLEITFPSMLSAIKQWSLLSWKKSSVTSNCKQPPLLGFRKWAFYFFFF